MYYFVDDSQITIYFSNGDIAVWNNTDSNFDRVIELCKRNEWVKIEVLHNKVKSILTGTIKINEEGDILLITDNNDIAIEDDNLTKFIKLLKEKGTIDSDIEAVKPFLRNMFENTYIDAVQEIYDYCKAMDFEITEDGCFLAYKKINPDMTSIYDNTTKHILNEYVSVDIFNTNRNQTCSEGLHFCSKEYLNRYGKDNSITIIVKINPKDVVSIPINYSYIKGRCCGYIPIAIIDENIETIKDVITTDPIVENKQNKVETENRLQETYRLMKQHNNIANYVAEIMNISESTVKRNMLKYKARYGK
jgi:hypothetical protein